MRIKTYKNIKSTSVLTAAFALAILVCFSVFTPIRANALEKKPAPGYYYSDEGEIEPGKTPQTQKITLYDYIRDETVSAEITNVVFESYVGDGYYPLYYATAPSEIRILEDVFISCEDILLRAPISEFIGNFYYIQNESDEAWMSKRYKILPSSGKYEVKSDGIQLHAGATFKLGSGAYLFETRIAGFGEYAFMDGRFFLVVNDTVSAPKESQPSNWAKGLIAEAEAKGLLTADAARDFQKAMTREEYCGVIVTMVEKILGRGLPLPAVNPFNDTNSVFVQKAANFELVSGVGGGKYNPNAPITRQDYIFLLVKALRKLEIETGKTFLKPAASSGSFRDTASIAGYAREGVLVAYASGIITGTGDGNFSPNSSIDCQSGVIAVLNGYNVVEPILNSASQNFAPTGITVSPASVSVKIGETAVLTATVAPSNATDKTVAWSSSNTSIVTIKGNGTITGIGKGTAAITVRTINGKTAYCTVTVTEPVDDKDEKPGQEANGVKLAGVVIGETISAAEATLGTPYRTVNGTAQYRFYGTYAHFAILAVKDSVITGVYANYDLPASGNYKLFKDERGGGKTYAALAGKFDKEPPAVAEAIIFETVNAFRGFHGVYALIWNDKLGTAARLHSEDMATRRYFSHISPEGKSPADRMTAAGYRWIDWAENITVAYVSGVEAVDTWAHSNDGHREQMLTRNYIETGVGCADRSGSPYVTYATQKFGYPADGLPSASNPPSQGTGNLTPPAGWIKVPNTAGLPEAEARSILASAGFLSESRYVSSVSIAKGIVTSSLIIDTEFFYDANKDFWAVSGTRVTIFVSA